MEIVLAIVVVIAAICLVGAHLHKKRREFLMAKYNDQTVVDRIMRKLIWQGMSEGQLLDSWGHPAAKDQKLYKTKSTEIFKYNQTSRKRFSNRVRVENGIVVGWEKK